jgi:hypothetical protein
MQDESVRMTREIAEQGWLVEVVLTSPNSQAEAVFFAVAELTATEAENAVLRYPGILPSDTRIARRGLLAAEISSLRLRPGGARPYSREAGQVRSGVGGK